MDAFSSHMMQSAGASDQQVMHVTVCRTLDLSVGEVLGQDAGGAANATADV